MIKKWFCFLFIILLVACVEKEKNIENQHNSIIRNKKEGKILRIGSITKNFLNIEDQFKPFELYMVDQISEFGYTSTQSVLCSTLKELEDKINQGEVDLYSGSLFTTIYLDVKSDLNPVLKRAIDDEYSVNTILFTIKNSGINSLDDLLGKVIVFEHAYSTSGYYYPKMFLMKNGYKLVEVKDPKEKIEKDCIGYCFSNSDENTVAWVINGYAAAGATDNTSYHRFSGARQNQLIELHRSKDFLRFVVSFNRNLSKKLQERLARVFIDYPSIAVKDTLLKKYYEQVKYDFIEDNEYTQIKSDLEKYLLQ